MGGEGQPHRQQGCSSVWQLGSWFLHPSCVQGCSLEINDILMISLLIQRAGLLLYIRIASQKTKVENKEEM